MGMAFKNQIIWILLLLFWVTLLFMAMPFLTSFNIQYIQSSRDVSKGIMLFGLTILVCMVQKISFAQLMYKFEFIGIQWCNCLNMMIYNKSLKYSTLANKEFSEAEIINYSQTDAERMTYAGFQLSSFFYGPLQIMFALAMMYFYVGWSFLCGVGVVTFMLILNYFISNKINYYN
jgi:ATP-binding cassette, subfamily C (CFTR/MRP), member 1